MGADNEANGKATGKKPLPKSAAMLERIMAFNEAKGGGVLIEKRSKGYSLFREDNGLRQHEDPSR